jgi:NAD(P)-dependent dehydrogenase (short-subunit alcohol dehydrogenase family)
MTQNIAAVATHAGKVALCIGSASGIGARTAERLAAGGAKVVIGDIDLVRAERTVRGIRGAGGEAVALPCDISDESEVAAFVQAAVDKHGGIDLAHLNAADVATGAKDMDP